jgi:transcriptional regulator with XRE-family HTH domain
MNYCRKHPRPAAEATALATLAGAIRVRRTGLGLSVREAARRAGLSDHKWRLAESGVCSPRASCLPLVAAVLGCTVADLFDAPTPPAAAGTTTTTD